MMHSPPDDSLVEEVPREPAAIMHPSKGPGRSFRKGHCDEDRAYVSDEHLAE